MSPPVATSPVPAQRAQADGVALKARPIAIPPLTKLTPELEQQVKDRNTKTLNYLINTNSITRYFSTADKLAPLRAALNTTAQPTDNIYETFRASVSLSTYKDYEPYIRRFLASKPLNKADVEDMFAPGLPFFIAHSSATSGKTAKLFPKYRHPAEVSAGSAGVMGASNPELAPGKKSLVMYTMRHREVVTVVDADGEKVKSIPVCLMSTGSIRMALDMELDTDSYRMQYKVPTQTSPMAICWVADYKANLVLHAFFALCDKELAFGSFVFSTILLDFCRAMQENWVMLVDCVEKGVLPPVDGYEEVREQLERHVSPHPDRAAELRSFTSSLNDQGILKRIWPDLDSVVAISSGIFFAAYPSVRHLLGPDVLVRSLGITSSESLFGRVYDVQDMNLFEIISGDEVIEFLPADEEDEAEEGELVPVAPWEVQVGKQYEIIPTTRDGLWRYRMSDVVQVVGFHPTSGQPVVRFRQRRNVAIRLANEYTTEDELTQAAAAACKVLGIASEFTVLPENEHMPPSYGFVLELGYGMSADPLIPLGPAARQAIQSQICSANDNYKRELASGKLGLPTIRLLAPGTFRDYRDIKVRESKSGWGQIKIPAAVYDERTKEFLLERVVAEL
ncbi:GH3 auxin-responsive promoter [Fimicolochytrium jonesii]|uniref:GH3 auxin-responsive promoter n=1 Tax=Fimicolochytrium jonesii TaxID=1396493 RepID=UPI0022FF3311|nr:GH3 auxin-responsive promoter [Fimicolochytrium jonesii]KAI8820286.1 GH3 auxin-responsive promoter [Fimicolochytrium jonesii]